MRSLSFSVKILYFLLFLSINDIVSFSFSIILLISKSLILFLLASFTDSSKIYPYFNDFIELSLDFNFLHLIFIQKQDKYL